jgi:formyltetrahydrofolate hydrolase
MKKELSFITVIGLDKKGIVAKISNLLYQRRSEYRRYRAESHGKALCHDHADRCFGHENPHGTAPEGP